MENEELIRRVKDAYYNLNNAKNKLDNALKLLNESIVINNHTFGSTAINDAKTKISNQMYTLDKKVLTELNK